MMTLDAIIVVCAGIMLVAMTIIVVAIVGSIMFMIWRLIRG